MVTNIIFFAWIHPLLPPDNGLITTAHHRHRSSIIARIADIILTVESHNIVGSTNADAGVVCGVAFVVDVGNWHFEVVEAIVIVIFPAFATTSATHIHFLLGKEEDGINF